MKHSLTFRFLLRIIKHLFTFHKNNCVIIDNKTHKILTIQIKSLEQYFSVVLFASLHCKIKVGISFLVSQFWPLLGVKV